MYGLYRRLLDFWSYRGTNRVWGGHERGGENGCGFMLNENVNLLQTKLMGGVIAMRRASSRVTLPVQITWDCWAQIALKLQALTNWTLLFLSSFHSHNTPFETSFTTFVNNK